MTTMEELEAQGWFLSQEGIDLLVSENPQLKDVNDFIAAAKDTDLRLLSTKGFNKTNEKVTLIPSPCVLQVLDIRNVAMPSVNQIEKPRLLSITFTDGSKRKYKGVEVLGKVDCIKLHTPPGTKFLVTKPIEIKDQICLLGPNMLIELGGHVQELVQAWRAGKQFLKRFKGKSSSSKEGDQDQGPPPFVPFKVKANSTATEKPAVKNEKPVVNKKNKKESDPSVPKDIKEKASFREQQVDNNKKPRRKQQPLDKKGEPIVTEENDQLPAEKPKHNKKTRKLKKDVVEQNGATAQEVKAITPIEGQHKDDLNNKKEKKSDSRKKERTKKKEIAEKSESVDHAEKAEGTQVNKKEITERKKRPEKKERKPEGEEQKDVPEESQPKTPTKRKSKRKTPAEKVENADASSTTEQVNHVDERENTEKVDTEKSDTKKTDSSRKSNNRKPKKVDSNKNAENSERKTVENSERNVAQGSKNVENFECKNTENVERKKKKRSKRKESLARAVDGIEVKTTTNNQSSKPTAEGQPEKVQPEQQPESNLGVEKRDGKPRKDRKKKTFAGAENVNNEDNKIPEKKEKEKPRKNNVDNENNKPTNNNNTQQQQHQQDDYNKKRERKPKVNEPLSVPETFTPPISQSPPQPHYQQPQHTPTTAPNTSRQPEQPMYYYQQPYTPAGVEYSMMLPMIDPNTGMTMYGYQQQPYMQPVYYMPDQQQQQQQQQPYYNHHQYMQPQASYYDHHHYNNYRGRGRGRGGNSNNRGGYDQ